MKFALYFGNRGFFPGELIAGAIEDFKAVLAANGYEYLLMPGGQTRYDAVETPAEGKAFADFLAAHKGEYDGVIVSLPNFGDENGAQVALRDAGVPILVQAYPDEAGQMDFAHRRDALCGKLAMCNVLRQCGIPFTLTKSFTVSPRSPEFVEDLRRFAAICRVVKGMKRFNLGAIGARTTAFKTVRCDEVAMQNKGINIETIDLSVVFRMMEEVDAAAAAKKAALLREYADCAACTGGKLDQMARFAVALDALVAKYDLQALAVRCWDELEIRCGFAPCMVMSVLNDTGIPTACELDINNAVMMRAVALAADAPVAVFDVNNNYGGAHDRCIFFHCSAAPRGLLTGKGTVKEHLMFRKSYGEGSGVGTYVGEMVKGPITVGSMKTEGGRICSFVTEGEFTDDPIEKDFFGCGAVFRKDDGDCEKMLAYMAKNGYRHHVSFVRGSWADAVQEAFDTYLGYAVDRI